MPFLAFLAVITWLQPGDSFAIGKSEIRCSGAGSTANWLRSWQEYGDFRLTFEYRLEQWAEAVVVLRAHAVGRPSLTGVPVQLAHDFHKKLTPHVTGAVAGVQAPRRLLEPGFGAWHKADLLLVGDRLEVRIDGELLNSVLVGDRHASGHIGFLDLGHQYQVRQVAVEERGSARAYQSLFNGRDLAGWQLRDAGEWAVRDGLLVAANGHGIHYPPGEFGSFELLAVFRTHGHVNSGVFLRGSPDKTRYRGFEVQIYSPPDAVYPTGSIYGLVRGDLAADHENQWTLLRVRVLNGIVTTWVDGRLAATGPVPAEAPAVGRVGLQIHLENASIKVRELRVRALEEAK